jgi:hypothetical protein
LYPIPPYIPNSAEQEAVGCKARDPRLSPYAIEKISVVEMQVRLGNVALLHAFCAIGVLPNQIANELPHSIRILQHSIR